MGSGWSTPCPEVHTKSGKLRGRALITPAGTKYYAFLGVPYAKPPVGDLRFKAPEPVEPWDGVRDAVQEGNMCAQNLVFTLPEPNWSAKAVVGMLKAMPAVIHRVRLTRRMSEDCLYLNIFVPAALLEQAAQDRAKRPVLFWIHGGGLQMCDANPDLMAPELFLDKNLVVVTPNYRLGPFGFLALGTADVPGNAGFKDQLLALKWTHDNIEAFGGDPSAITVYGESAGGCSAHFHHISPSSKGLFRGVIASSGTAFAPWSITKRNLEVARSLVKELGVTAESPEELAKVLRAASTTSILNAVKNMSKEGITIDNELLFLPVVEPDLPGAFIAEHPVDIVRAGRHSAVPLMTGVCSAEGFVWLLTGSKDEKTLSHYNEIPLFLVPSDMRPAMTQEEAEQCHKDILQEYTGGKPFSRECIPDLIDLFGDIFFMMRLPILTREYLKTNLAPVYTYRFSFEGKLNFLRNSLQPKLKGMRNVKGSAHGDDLCYLSQISLFPIPPVADDSREGVCRRRMVQLWANFVETGDPTPASSDQGLLPVRWVPASNESQPFLDIDDTLEMRTDDLYPRQKFWDELHKKYWHHPKVTE